MLQRKLMGQGSRFRSGYFHHGIGKNDYLHASPASSAGLGVTFFVHPSKTMREFLVCVINKKTKIKI
jgi:hypothetical protein